MVVLWRDPWLKPLSDFDIGSESCKHCQNQFAERDFVTSCEFCQVGIMHDRCANSHIMAKHPSELEAKIKAHKDKPLHGFQ